MHRDSTRPGESTSKRSVPDHPLENGKSVRSFFASADNPQDDELSTRVKYIFSRAANLMRQSIRAEGVAFMDANSDLFGSLVDNTSRKVTGSRSPDFTESSEEDSEPGSSPAGEDGESSSLPAACACLGFATSQVSSVNDDTMADQKMVVEAPFVKTLLRRYPQGKTFTYDANPSASDDSDDTIHTVSGSEKPDTEGDAAGAKRQRHPISKKRQKRTFQQDAGHLIKIFPDARKILFLPMWNTATSRCFAQILVWTDNPEHVFTAENDLAYISAFANIASWPNSSMLMSRWQKRPRPTSSTVSPTSSATRFMAFWARPTSSATRR